MLLFHLHRRFHRRVSRFLLLAAVLFALHFPAPPVQAAPLDGLSASERSAVEKCLVLIRARYLTSGTAKGAFRRATNTGDAWIEHYFTLEAMLAVLATIGDPKSPAAQQDLQKVATYLSFYAQDALKQPQGVAHNFDGPLNNPQYIVPTSQEVTLGIFKDYDSIDSYAGLFLLASARYYKLTGKLPPQVPEALLVSLRALNRVINDKEGVSREGGYTWAFPNGARTNGLPIARASYPIHQLLDAIETHAGLRESVDLFSAIGKAPESQQALTLANGIAQGVSLFDYVSTKNSYAFRLDNGNFPSFDNQLYPGVLANLFALSYLPSKGGAADSKLWAQLRKQAPDDQDKYPATVDAPSERWLIAATRVAPQEVVAWRKTVVSNVGGFGAETYIERMAITILALLGGPAQYPAVQNPPTLTVSDPAMVKEGNSGTTPQTFVVRLSQPSKVSVAVDWATAEGTANSIDYAGASGQLKFAPGETSKSIVIRVKGDTTVEPTENYQFNLRSPTHAVLGDSQAVASIANDDKARPSASLD